MNTKLTLSLKKDIIEAAKVYAKNSGRSLSEIIEVYLSKLINGNSDGQDEIPSNLKSLYGCISLPEDFDEKKAIRDILYDKHMK